MKSKSNLFYPSRYDYLRIVDDNKKILGAYCGSELRGKVFVVTGNYALITFHSDGSIQYQGFQLTILFTQAKDGMFK